MIAGTVPSRRQFLCGTGGLVAASAGLAGGASSAQTAEVDAMTASIAENHYYLTDARLEQGFQREHDIVVATTTAIRRALERLKLSKLLDGFRGRPKVDMDALAARLAELGDFVLAQADSFAEIEVNPLFVHQNSMTAVDALIHAATPPAMKNARR